MGMIQTARSVKMHYAYICTNGVYFYEIGRNTNVPKGYTKEKVAVCNHEEAKPIPLSHIVGSIGERWYVRNPDAVMQN